ncbi:ORF6N domain-containing protein [Geoalkalibacter subterraneus]|uniref:ORF6N domain-containing protein n=1 Tax=Geoalkalibacter subterraneus TaxID=483547 RepID=UPI000694A85C|nr:ORF6N domain-containing protein [Geoalkalibacter subterraneus]
MSKKQAQSYLDDVFDSLFQPAVRSAVLADAGAKIYQLADREPFMVQSDLAKIYGVTTRELNQARNRNPAKFQEGTAYFQLERREVTKCDIAYNGGHLPYAYTRRGAYMFATILQTPEATEQAIRIVEGFMAFEHALEKQDRPAAPSERFAPAPQAATKTRTIPEDRYYELIECENRMLRGVQRARIAPDMKRQIITYHNQGLKPAKIRDLTGVNINTIATQIYKHKRGELE